MITRSGGEFGHGFERRLRRIDRLDLKLRMQSKLLDERVPQVDVIVNDQYSPRLGHDASLTGTRLCR